MANTQVARKDTAAMMQRSQKQADVTGSALYLTWGSNRYRKAVDMLGVCVVHFDDAPHVEHERAGRGGGGG